MWHEARKQEKKIRGMMVDYKRRAERRRDYYEKIKQDPAQFLQVHGRPAKIHLDPAVAIAADSPATMMPWQGHSDNLIDRFDVRAHLDIIPEYKPKEGDDPIEDRQACYERYRTLVQNDFLGVNEDKFLHQIFMEERYGIFKPGPEDEKKKLLDKKAAIGYVYEDSTESPTRSAINKDAGEDDEENEEEKEEDLSDLDLDVTVDVSILTPFQCSEMNEQSLKYGMVDDDFITYLLQDKDEADQLRLAREIEEEKAMYSGRKSRRERRALREKKLAGRKITSPPSYAARESPTYAPMRHSTSKSRSRSPPEAGKIMFITSFGGETSDHEQNKSGTKTIVSSSKSGKTKSKDSSGSVIGPQLPSRNGEDEKQSRTSRSSPVSDSSYRSKRKNTKNIKHHSHGRSRYRSQSSSSRSRSPKKSDSRNRRKRSHRNSFSSRSRSHSISKSRSRSRSRLQSSRHAKARSLSKSRSDSKSKTDEKSQSPQLPPPPIKSYYRHSLSRSNSELSDDSDGDKSSVTSTQLSNITSSSRLQPLLGKAGPTTKGSKLTPQERLKRKMQIALKKQYKADKKAQMEKTEKQQQERQDRAEELREMAIKLRQRERERRHKMRGYGYDSDSDTTWTRNPDYDPRNPDSHYSKKPDHVSSRSSSYSSEEHSPARSNVSSNRRRSRSKSLTRKSRRSPAEDRRRSPTHHKRSPLLKSPHRKSPLLKSPPRNSTRSPRKSPRRSPQHSRRSPDRNYRNSRSRQSPRRYGRTSPRRCSPPRSPRRSTSSRHYRQENYSESRSRSPPKSYSSRPLVDY